MYSPSRSPLPPPSLPGPSESSQCTRPKHLLKPPIKNKNALKGLPLCFFFLNSKYSTLSWKHGFWQGIIHASMFYTCYWIAEQGQCSMRLSCSNFPIKQKCGIKISISDFLQWSKIRFLHKNVKFKYTTIGKKLIHKTLKSAVREMVSF